MDGFDLGGSSGGGGGGTFGRSEAHTTIGNSGDINFGGGSRLNQITLLVLAASAGIMLLVVAAIIMQGGRR